MTKKKTTSKKTTTKKKTTQKKVAKVVDRGPWRLTVYEDGSRKRELRG